MRLATVQTETGARVVAWRDGSLVDLTDTGFPATVRGLLEAGDAALAAVQRMLVRDDRANYDPARVKWLPPIPDGGGTPRVGLRNSAP